MEIQSWNDKKNRICSLIKLISENYGGDEKEFIDEYCREIIQKYSNDLDKALDCFEDLYKQCST
jgi:hypothetical protein